EQDRAEADHAAGDHVDLDRDDVAKAAEEEERYHDGRPSGCQRGQVVAERDPAVAEAAGEGLGEQRRLGAGHDRPNGAGADACRSTARTGRPSIRRSSTSLAKVGVSRIASLTKTATASSRALARKGARHAQY